MVINWNTPEDDKPPDPPRVRAAEYVRMSTEHQQYSTDNQAVAIRRFAEAHGYEIVHTYKDDGKSGLNLAGRSGLRSLLADIDAGHRYEAEHGGSCPVRGRPPERDPTDCSEYAKQGVRDRAV